MSISILKDIEIIKEEVKMLKQITDSDMIILNSVESYLKTLGIPVMQNPQEQLMVVQQAKDFMYSDIARRVPRVAAYILSADMETDTVAQGLFFSLSKHLMDPVFVKILMQYLQQMNNGEDNGITGAFMAKVMNRYMEANWKEENTSTPKKDKKDKKDKTETTAAAPVVNDMSAIKHIQEAVHYLLGNMAGLIASRCGNLTQSEAIAIAACIAMNNRDTITEIIKSDLPVTADIFNIVQDPSNLIKNALLLDKSEFTKLSSNQSAFVDSLKRWVYDKLNQIPTQESFKFLVSVYGSIRPTDTGNRLIQLKDCGMQYSNLLTVAKSLIN